VEPAIRKLFSEREWRTLQFAPLWVFAAVAGADSKIDKKERLTLAKELAGASICYGKLAFEVLSSVFEELPDVLREYDADSRDVANALREVDFLLSQKVTPQEARDFKEAIYHIGRLVAQASGGIFGIGRRGKSSKGSGSGSRNCTINLFWPLGKLGGVNWVPRFGFLGQIVDLRRQAPQAWNKGHSASASVGVKYEVAIGVRGGICHCRFGCCFYCAGCRVRIVDRIPFSLDDGYDVSPARWGELGPI